MPLSTVGPVQYNDAVTPLVFGHIECFIRSLQDILDGDGICRDVGNYHASANGDANMRVTH
jgi:hypothetical protein